MVLPTQERESKPAILTTSIITHHLLSLLHAAACSSLLFKLLRLHVQITGLCFSTFTASRYTILLEIPRTNTSSSTGISLHVISLRRTTKEIYQWLIAFGLNTFFTHEGSIPDLGTTKITLANMISTTNSDIHVISVPGSSCA